MKVSSSYERKDGISSYLSFKGIPANPKYLPNAVGKIGKLVGEYVSTPEQKLFLATTALMFQPLIDLKFADEEKRTDSAIKSAAKAMAGGFTGVAIRAFFLKLTEHFIGFDKHNKLNLHFFPDEAIKLKEASNAMANVRMKQYCQTLGTLFAVLFMILFSNSKVDVPLTSDLQDIISGVVKDKKSWTKSIVDTCKNRGKKISNWFNKKKDFILKVKDKAKKVIVALQEDSPKPEENKK